jgi:hypothetical protein
MMAGWEKAAKTATLAIIAVDCRRIIGDFAAHRQYLFGLTRELIVR